MKKPKIISMSLIAVLVTSGIFFSVYFSNKIKNLKDLRASIENLYTSDTLITDTPKGLTELDLLFPKNGRTTEFIENIFLLSKKYSINNMQVEYKSHEAIDLGSGQQIISGRGSSHSTGAIYVHPIRLNFKSGYRNMAEFIGKLQDQQRLVTIKKLKVNKEKDILSSELILNVYSTEEK